MHRLNCGFKLKAAEPSVLERLGEMAFCLFYYRKRPLLGVLLGKSNVPAILSPSRRAPGFAVKHES